MLGLHYYLGFCLVAASRAYSLVAVHGLLIVVASLVEEHGLSGERASVVAAHGLSNCGSRKHRLSSCGSRKHRLSSCDLGTPRPACETFLQCWADSLPLSHQGSPILFHFNLLNGFPVHYHVSVSQPVVAAFEKYCPRAEISSPTKHKDSVLE